MVHLGNSCRKLLVVGSLSVVGVTALGQSPALAAAPQPKPDSYTTPMNTTLNVAAPGVLANDTDPDGDRLTAGMPSDPTYGSLTLQSNGAFTYTPNNNYTGPDSFSYMAHDGTGGMVTGIVSITVGGGGGGGTGSFSISDKSVVEGDAGTVKGILFTVTRSGSTAAAASVTYSTANGTAMAGSDYKAVAGTVVNFAAGVASKTVKVVVIGDSVDEPDETFSVNLSGASGATIADSTAIGTIVDNDGGSGGGATFSVNNVTVNEANNGSSTTAMFTVSRSSGTGTASVKVVTAPGTATKDVDYAHLPATLVSFAAGQTSKMVHVTVLGDNLNEANETFFLKLTTPVNGTIAVLKGKATIVDND